MKLKFTRVQLWLMFIFSTVLFSLGVFIIVKDVHITGSHSWWNILAGGFFICLSMGLMFPVQTALALKMIKDNVGSLIPVFGWRKGETPPPAGITPGTPVETNTPLSKPVTESYNDPSLKG